MANPKLAVQSMLMAPLYGPSIPFEQILDPVCRRNILGDGTATDSFNTILFPGDAGVEEGESMPRPFAKWKRQRHGEMQI